MKFIVHRNPFLEVLNKVQSIVEKKNTVPILSNILLSVENDLLWISATDLEVGIKMSLPVTQAQNGKITLNAKSFLEIVKELPQTTIEIIKKENDWVEIICGKSKFKIVSISANEYPALPLFEEKKYQEANILQLSEMIDKTGFAVSTDATRYHMNGVFLENLENKKMRMTATDGHRLAYLEHELFKELPEIKRGIIIPKKGLTELRKFIETDLETIKLGFERGYLFAQLNGSYLFIRLIEGEYPDYRLVIPKETPKVLRMDKEEFYSALKRVSLLSHEKSKGVKFSIQPGLMTIYSSNPDLGEAKEELDIHYTGEALSVGFNSKYLLECLSVSSSERVYLKLKDHLSPGIVQNEAQENSNYIIMPMRI